MKVIAIAPDIDLSAIPHIDRRCDSSNLYLIESPDDYVNLPPEIYAAWQAEQAAKNEVPQ